MLENVIIAEFMAAVFYVGRSFVLQILDFSWRNLEISVSQVNYETYLI